MNKDEILKASRRENKNRDPHELEVMIRAGNIAGRVAVLVCCIISLLSSIIAETMLYSPWAIYFGLIGTDWLVRFIYLKKKSDLVLAVMFFLLFALAMAGLISRLIEVNA